MAKRPKKDTNRVRASDAWLSAAYFKGVGRIQAELAGPDNLSDDGVRERAAIALVLAIAAVESFVNIWFRFRCEEEAHREHREAILCDLSRRVGLREKLKRWPLLLYGKQIDFSGGAPQRFLDFLDLRNHLMHFSSDFHEEEIQPNVHVRGLADVSRYHELTAESVWTCPTACYDTMRALLAVAGLTNTQQLLTLQRWTGTVPDEGELQAAQELDSAESDDI